VQHSATDGRQLGQCAAQPWFRLDLGFHGEPLKRYRRDDTYFGTFVTVEGDLISGG
jgi:hypothetical protein